MTGAMHLGRGIYLPIEAVTQKFGILAVSGAGKSNLAAVMAEEMYRLKLPFVSSLFNHWPEPVTKGTILSEAGYASSGPVSKVFARLVRIGYATKTGSSLLRASDDFFN